MQRNKIQRLLSSQVGVEKNDTKLNLNGAEQIIFDIIGVEPKGFDEIQILTGLSTEELLVRLTEMELSGLIEQVEGDRYGISR